VRFSSNRAENNEQRREVDRNGDRACPSAHSIASSDQPGAPAENISILYKHRFLDAVSSLAMGEKYVKVFLK